MFGCANAQTDDEESWTNSDAASACSDTDGSENDGVPEPDLTEVGCYINMVRGNLGPGCLSLPHAFAATGIWLSLGLSLPILALCIFSFNVLLWAKDEVVAQGLAPQGVRLSYSDIAVAVLGPTGRVLVELGVCTTQFGVCTVFYSFVSRNLVEVFPGLAQRQVIMAMMPVAGVMTLIRTPGKLAVFSALGNICMFLGILLVIVALAPSLSEGLPAIEQKPLAVWSTAATFASNIIYSFEGIALMIPMESAMLQPAKFPKVMNASMSNVAFVFVAFGVYCLVGLQGVIPDGSISASLEGRVPVALLDACNAVLALAVLVTYPLQFYPAIEIVDVHLGERGVGRGAWQTTAVRIGMSTVCGCMALAVPDVSLLVSLVGSLGCPLLGLIIPPLLHLRTGPQPVLIFALELLCFALGICCAVFGTYSAVCDIIARGSSS